jgi:nicotinate-nucleotide adenylyltransferase
VERSGGAIGIFGGTFDPVHYGHLRTALELRDRLGFDRVHFVPAAIPPHRGTPVASPAVRLRMLEAALADEPGFVLDQRELEREGPSYSVDTAESLRREFPEQSLSLILGMDAFLGLPGWRDWRRLLSLVHIVVAHRPGCRPPSAGLLGELLGERGTDAAAEILGERAGRILIAGVTQLGISATALRDSIRAGLPARYLMPDAVWRIIDETECYAEKTQETAVAESYR